MLASIVFDTNQRCRIARKLEGVRHHQGDRLSAELDLCTVKRSKRRTGWGNVVAVVAIQAWQTWNVLVRANLQQPIETESGAGSNAEDFSFHSGAGHNNAIGEVRQIMFGGVFSGASDFGPTVNAVQWLSGVCGDHFRSPF